LDVCSSVVQASAYATTVRRKRIDVAPRVIRHSGKITLKVTPDSLSGTQLIAAMAKKFSTTTVCLAVVAKFKIAYLATEV
jgi:hypothetical protein